jgi:hypothetical protein
LKGFFVVTGGGKKWRSPIGAVGPNLGMIEDVVERAVGRARCFVKNPVEQAVSPLAEFLDRE